MTTSIRTAGLAILAAAGLALTACAPGGSEQPAPASDGTQPGIEAPAGGGGDTQPDGPVVVPEVLDFTAKTANGDTFEGASILGTPTIIWVWAEWCHICQGEASSIRDALDELPDGVQALGLAGYSSDEGMDRFIKGYDLGLITNISDPNGELWANFGVAAQPAIVLIDAEGKVRVIPGASGKNAFLEAAASIA